eukprot:11173150-Lingulodinium_polyedra.AAC.1
MIVRYTTSFHLGPPGFVVRSTSIWYFWSISVAPELCSIPDEILGLRGHFCMLPIAGMVLIPNVWGTAALFS